VASVDKKEFVPFAESVVHGLATEENDEALATLANILSLRYQDIGELERALEFQLKALTIREKILGENHPDLATSYHNLSTLYAIKKDYPAALTYSAKAVAIMKKLFPGGHPHLTSAEKNKANIERGNREVRKL
jgi:tetratricopeptide (TPR) repeat protein